MPWNDPAADIRLALDSGHGAVLVGCEGPDILASVMVGHDGHRGWLYYLAVDSAQREAGFGRQIVEAAENSAAERHALCRGQRCGCAYGIAVSPRGASTAAL